MFRVHWIIALKGLSMTTSPASQSGLSASCTEAVTSSSASAQITVTDINTDPDQAAQAALDVRWDGHGWHFDVDLLIDV